MIEITTNTPAITQEEIFWDLGDCVIHHLTKNDHKPFDKWNVADKIPTKYNTKTTGFVKIVSIISKSTVAPKNAF